MGPISGKYEFFIAEETYHTFMLKFSVADDPCHNYTCTLIISENVSMCVSPWSSCTVEE